MMKRLIEVLAAMAALLLLSPVLMVVAVAIYAGDRGSVLFRQCRAGMNGREFSIYKFRCMVLNAEKIGGYSMADGDPRITRIGRFIRRTRIDELPQLFNVLLGDMSLVGLRPDVPVQRGMYTEMEWIQRLQVRPGITGLAQATLRSDATAEQRKQMDLRYAKEVSVLLDVKIIILTFKQVFGKGGN